ncbi:MAG: type II secretion system protein [Planctomycetota bacterium]|jgi:hypothetical protein
MNKRQRTILIEFIIVMALTTVAVVAMICFRDWVNRSEAMRAMEQLGQRVLNYRKVHGLVPPESYVDGIKEDLEGHVRLGDVQYRGLWIDFDSTDDEILAYAQRDYHSLVVGRGYIVLRLDGRVEWLGKEECEGFLAEQQSPTEVQMLRE